MEQSEFPQDHYSKLKIEGISKLFLIYHQLAQIYDRLINHLNIYVNFVEVVKSTYFDKVS